LTAGVERLKAECLVSRRGRSGTDAFHGERARASATPPCAPLRLVAHLSRCRWAFAWKQIERCRWRESVESSSARRSCPWVSSCRAGPSFAAVSMGIDRRLLPSWLGVRSSLHSECRVAVKARLTSADSEGVHAEAVFEHHSGAGFLRGFFRRVRRATGRSGRCRYPSSGTSTTVRWA
jgi:hypothetical protein